MKIKHTIKSCKITFSAQKCMAYTVVHYNYNGKTRTLMWLVSVGKLQIFPYQHPHFTKLKIRTSAFYPWPCRSC